MAPEPRKRPRSSYIRFAAQLPNECWQSDFIHWHLAGGREAEIVSWIDDHSRYALRSPRTRSPRARPLATFRAAVAAHGAPASTLTDNGMVYTTRFSGGRGGRNALEHELRALGVTQKNGRPNHPQTQGKVERFQQTLQKWLTAQPPAATSPNSRPSSTPSPPTTTPAARTAPWPTAPPRPPRMPPGPKPPPATAAPIHTTGSAPTASTPTAPSPCATPAALPHRHRPDLCPNPRPAARPGPAHPRHPRRHRRTAPRTRTRPHPQLPAHRPPTRTPETNTPPTPHKKKPRTLVVGSGSFRCPETSMG